LNPSVAIVILNYNGQKYLEQFLPSVLATTYPNIEIVVADNGSTDDSLIFLKNEYPSVTVLSNSTNEGFAGGYNWALKRVEAQYYVLLNSDV
jgi:GT2 family glycosyltransferase